MRGLCHRRDDPICQELGGFTLGSGFPLGAFRIYTNPGPEIFCRQLIRTVKPELLDRLPPDDPAVHPARRDLRMINALMRNHRWIVRRLQPVLRPGDRIVEWGGGDGSLARLIADRLGPPHDSSLTVIDQAPRPEGLQESVRWHSRDLLDFRVPLPESEIVVANLVLHHFESESLAQLGAFLNHSCRVLIACEPARRHRHQWQARLLSILGVHAITRHDARVSVAAGFRRDELPRLLNLQPSDWTLTIRETALGAYRLFAVRQ